MLADSPSVAPIVDITSQRILDAAEELFADHGFEGVAVRAICEKAGVKNIGAVNYYFGGKEGLYRRAVGQAMELCTQGAAFPTWTTETPLQKLEGFIRTMMHRLLTIPRNSAMKLMTREMTDPTPACAEGMERHIRPMQQMLCGIVTELMPDCSEPKRWMASFSIIGQCLYYRQNRAAAIILYGADNVEALTAEMIVDHIVEMSFCGIMEHLSPEHRREAKRRIQKKN